MFRRPEPFSAKPDSPFAGDKLGRDKHIIELTNLIQGTDTPLVMTVSAPWGGGKTSFITMWKAYLESEQGGSHPCILFDAWKHDFNREPLLACMGEIGSVIKPNEGDAQNAEDAFGKALKFLPGILKYSSSLASLAGLAVPGASIAGKGLQFAGAAVEEVAKLYVSEGHQSAIDTLKRFKESMEECVKAVTNDYQKPLYFFVDELDRCEPVYAIKLLESIKHFFDVKGIVFVLSVDRDRLAGMVKVRYGDCFGEEGYLKRFVDVDYQIPKAEHERFIRYLCEDVLRLTEYPVANTKERLDEFVNVTSTLANDLSMQPRDIEKVLVKSFPFLRQHFSLVGNTKMFTGDKPEGSIIKYLSGGLHVGLPDMLWGYVENYFYPIVILGFLKEASYTRYMNYKKIYLETTNFSGVDRDGYRSKYLRILNELYKPSANFDIKKEIEKAVSEGASEDGVKIPLLVAKMLSVHREYWPEKEKEIRSQLDSLNNITFFAQENESEVGEK